MYDCWLLAWPTSLQVLTGLRTNFVTILATAAHSCCKDICASLVNETQLSVVLFPHRNYLDIAVVAWLDWKNTFWCFGYGGTIGLKFASSLCGVAINDNLPKCLWPTFNRLSDIDRGQKLLFGLVGLFMIHIVIKVNMIWYDTEYDCRNTY